MHAGAVNRATLPTFDFAYEGEIDAGNLITLYEVEERIKRLKPNTTSGLGGLSRDVLKLAPHATARRLHHLLMKMHAHARRPMEARGQG